jgi:hypothetical protein
VQDAIRLTPHLTLSLGLRAESSSGWNEAHGRAATYTYPGGVISNQPTIGDSAFTENNRCFCRSLAPVLRGALLAPPAR